jgi:serine protease Do
MNHQKKWLPRIFFFTLLFSFSLTCFSAPYQPPEIPKQISPDEDIEAVAKISRGVQKIARGASSAIVFVSITKPIEDQGQLMFDPFRFFFGPDSPFSAPPGQPNANPNRQMRPRQKIMGIGSGFILDLAKGYIITNNHVVEGADEIHLRVATGKDFVGKVVGTDPNTDIAVVQIKDQNFPKDNLSQLYFGDSDAIQAGDFVLALGAPFGLEATVTFGVISATKRGPLEITKIGNFIQTDAAINPGNSGGPLLNMYGQVIGVNTAIFSQSGSYSGVGLAVPSSLVRTIATELINKGKVERGYMGAQLTDVSPEVAKELKVPEGVGGALVSHVIKGEPADKAGLRPGDIIAAVNGKSVKSASDVVNEVGLLKPNTNVALTIYRDGKKNSITVQIKSYVAQNKSAGQATSVPAVAENLGMLLEKITPELTEKFNLESKQGTVVAQVIYGSLAAQAGIRPGDAILDCNNKRVQNPGDVASCIKNSKQTLFRIERTGQYFYLTIRRD